MSDTNQAIQSLYSPAGQFRWFLPSAETTSTDPTARVTGTPMNANEGAEGEWISGRGH